MKTIDSAAQKRPETLTEADAPAATRHLGAGQKEALDLHAEAEHTDGRRREKLTRQITKLGGGAKRTRE